MNRRFFIPALVLINILVISFFIILYTNSAYPIVGNDYRLFGPRLLDTLLYTKVNGFGIEWYTPSFGGGLPAYPNPLQMQFSFQQLFTLFANPWVAIMLACMVYIAIGVWAAYRLMRDVLAFHPLAASLGAGFFVGCGFFIQRMIVGHTDKITFPLIAVPLYALLNRKLPAWLNGALIGLTGAIWLNSGGVYIGVMGLFTLLVALPMLYLLKPDSFVWKKVLAAGLWGAVLGLLLGGSKLYPITLYMRNFPRLIEDHYFVDLTSAIGGALLQLVGVMTTLPFLNLIGKSSLVLVTRLTQLTGTPYGFWEIDSSISPVLIGLLIYGAWRALQRPRIEKKDLAGKLIATALLIFGIILVFEFSAARGFLFDHLQKLAIFRSLRTNTRFVSAYVLPLAILGAKVFDLWLRGKTPRRGLAAYGVLNGLSLLALFSYYLLPIQTQYRSFDIRTVLKTYAGIQAGQTYPVVQIIPDMNDYEVFVAGASNVGRHYDPLLAGHSFLPQVHAGSVYDVTDGFFNFSDPSGYVFPAENHSELFARIPASEPQVLEDFLHRRKSDWKLPLIQVILDWAAGLTFILLFLAIGFYILRERFNTKGMKDAKESP